MNILSDRPEQESSHSSLQLIIKAKKRARKEGHHGGAWKIAYADFITAMMAFFLLMWILNVATDQQKKAIANYFNPIGTSPHPSSQPRVVDGPSTVAADTLPLKELMTPEIIQEKDASEGAEQDKKEALNASEQDKKEAAERKETIQKIKKALNTDPLFKELQAKIMIEEVPEGVRLQITDQERFSMFQKGSYALLPETRQLMGKMARIIRDMPYPVSITGHTDAHPFQTRRGYDNWELSSDRAHACRRALVEAGVPESQFKAVIGQADTELLVPEQPLDPRNRRMSIVLLYPKKDRK